jgi:asparagine synthase (glutamine-hydrolysing)
MCGIACIIELTGRPVDARTVHAMNKAARHRGPDAQAGSVLGRVGLGHTRLSIIDVDGRSNQPMARLGRHLVFNGEIYNYIEVRRDLIAKGHQFTTDSDTEVLLLALIEWGLAALERLNGMFAFVFFDEPAGQVWACRDRLGIKPLVFARSETCICFASEPKQILATGRFGRTADATTIARFLGQAALNDTEATFFAEIRDVAAGGIARLDLMTGNLDLKRWYVLEERVSFFSGSYDDAIAGVRERLKASIVRHLRSDVALGACLSGGIDSSVVVCLTRAMLPEVELPAISIYTQRPGYDERRFSRAVCRDTGAIPVEIEADTPQIWDSRWLEEIGYFSDQPTLSGSHYNQYLLYRYANQSGMKVVLDGQGADESFGGYGEFWFAAQIELLKSLHLVAFAQGLRANALSTGRSMMRETHSFVRNQIGRLRGSADGKAPEWLRQPVGGIHPVPTDFKGLSLLELTSTSLPYQLHSVDRNSMRWSVEARVPFLDHELVEFVVGLPTDFKVRKGVRKQTLRDAVPELPETVAQRRDKVGFASPDVESFHACLPEVREALTAAATNLEQFVDQARLMEHFERVVADGRGYDPAFFRILSLDGWRRAHGVGG